jgi:D-alanyl-lipoteichoic acid acyltransferase DltB (MBOAT superfamily)
MNFASDDFLYLILGVLPLWWWTSRKNQSLAFTVLLLGSALFYRVDESRLVLLLGAYCIWAWGTGLRIGRFKEKGLDHQAFIWLMVGISGTLVGLVFFKYTPMLVNTAVAVGEKMNWGNIPILHEWMIPAGISFITFTSIAYLADIYRGHTNADPNVLRVALHISFFPKLLAGPIVRPGEFLTRLQEKDFPGGLNLSIEALHLVARGYFKKVVLADTIAIAIDPFFLNVGNASTDGVWALPYLYLYALQIYFDFSAYTDIARGLGLVFGFRWPQNFNLPYLASNIREFWQRWHMTLSRFLRDYLYIPLGGNRCSGVRTSLNVMITMLLGGLWHGASWSFAVWGGLHGTYIIVHRLWSRTKLCKNLSESHGIGKWIWKWVMIAATFHFVCIAWAFFRITDFQSALLVLKKCIWFERGRLISSSIGDPSVWIPIFMYGIVISIMSGWLKTVSNNNHPAREIQGLFHRGFAIGFGTALLGLSWMLSPGEQSAFIYFQF